MLGNKIEETLLSKIEEDIDLYLNKEGSKIKGLNQQRIKELLSPLADNILKTLEIEFASFHANKNESYFTENEIDEFAHKIKEKIKSEFVESESFRFYYNIDDENREVLHEITNKVLSGAVNKMKDSKVDMTLSELELNEFVSNLKDVLRTKIIDFATHRSCSENVTKLLSEKTEGILGNTIDEIFSSFGADEVLTKEEMEKLKLKKKRIIKEAIMDVYSDENESELVEHAKEIIKKNMKLGLTTKVEDIGYEPITGDNLLKLIEEDFYKNKKDKKPDSEDISKEEIMEDDELNVQEVDYDDDFEEDEDSSIQERVEKLEKKIKDMYFYITMSFVTTFAVFSFWIIFN